MGTVRIEISIMDPHGHSFFRQIAMGGLEFLNSNRYENILKTMLKEQRSFITYTEMLTNLWVLDCLLTVQ